MRTDEFSRNTPFAPEALPGETRPQESSLSNRFPWDFSAKLRDFLRPGVRSLELEPGNGEYLCSLRQPFSLVAAAGRPGPGLEFCRKALGSWGAEIGEISEDGSLPFPEGSFDLVFSRGAPYEPRELSRVLKQGGHFIS